jgi:hypothetical protein
MQDFFQDEKRRQGFIATTTRRSPPSAAELCERAALGKMRGVAG